MSHLPELKQAALKAGAHVAKRFMTVSRGGVKFKKHNEIVTAVDRESERIVFAVIRKHFPSYSVLSEESGLTQRKSEYQWIVDPIDGTFNFIMGVPFFSVAIALVRGGTVIVGVIYDPMQKKLYHAEAGRGAYCNGKRIQVSAHRPFAHAFNTFTHGKTPRDARRIAELYARLRSNHISFRNIGCVSLQLAQVAHGLTDSYLGLSMHPWDYAAGALLVAEAGGTVSDFRGLPWNLRLRDMVAATPSVHAEFLRMVVRGSRRGRSPAGA